MDGQLSFFLYYAVLLSVHMTSETFFSNKHCLVVLRLVYDVVLLVYGDVLLSFFLV